MTRLFTILCAIAMACAAPAMSATINWSFKDAVFDDGGTIVGSFDWDTVNQSITGIDLRTTAGQSPFNGEHDYSTGSATIDLTNDPDRIIFRAGGRGLMVFGNLKLDSAGSIALQGTRNGFYECATCPNVRQSIGGASLVGVEVPVSPVPLPASLPVLAGALAGLGLVRRPRRRSASAR